MKLILIGNRDDDKAFSLELSSQLSMDWDTRSSISEVGVDAPDSELLVDINAFDSAEEFNRQLNSIPRPASVHLIANPETQNMPGFFESNHLASNIILRRLENAWKAGRKYAQTLAFARNSLVPGLEKFQFSKQALHRMQLNEPMQRRVAVSAIIRHLTEAGCIERLATHIAAAVDEILMNALMDAPLGRSATPEEINEATEGRSIIEHRPVDLEIGTNADSFAFVVTDHFGTLDSRVAIRHLCKAFGAENDIRKTGTGAGLGLALTFRSGASMVFNSDPGKKTEVSIFFSKTQSVKEFKNQFQYVSFFKG